MHCPNCNSQKSRVIESRPIEGVVWRRRICQSCHHLYLTTESLATSKMPWVRGARKVPPPKAGEIKSDGRELQAFFTTGLPR